MFGQKAYKFYDKPKAVEMIHYYGLLNPLEAGYLGFIGDV